MLIRRLPVSQNFHAPSPSIPKYQSNSCKHLYSHKFANIYQMPIAFDPKSYDFNEFALNLHNFDEFDLTLHDFNEFDLTLHDFDEFDLTLHDFNEFDSTLCEWDTIAVSFTLKFWDDCSLQSGKPSHVNPARLFSAKPLNFKELQSMCVQHRSRIAPTPPQLPNPSSSMRKLRNICSAALRLLEIQPDRHQQSKICCRHIPEIQSLRPTLPTLWISAQ